MITQLVGEELVLECMCVLTLQPRLSQHCKGLSNSWKACHLPLRALGLWGRLYGFAASA